MTTIYFDLETGGLEDHHPDIQIAAVAVDSIWRELASFKAKIAFDEAQAQPEALKLNHYDPAIWESQAQLPLEVWRSFAKWLNPYRPIRMISQRSGEAYTVARLAGYNAARFDGPRLKAAFKRHNLFLPAHPMIREVAQLALWYFDCRESGHYDDSNLKLESLCRRFGIQLSGEFHDPLADVRATVMLARQLEIACGLSV